ncbi:MAG: hypothetical protein LC437_07795 [Thiohalomonas sp.]|nr:hypothetical protein [Thiohalomonas sp.]
MKYAEPLIKARLIKRYKRFLADVELFELDVETQQPKQMTIHTANTGSMKGVRFPAASFG